MSYEVMTDIQYYAMFDRVCRRELKITGDEFLALYRAGVYDAACPDYWRWVDTYFMRWDSSTKWEPALFNRWQFMHEVLNDKIDEWHSGMGEGLELHEYLGWTLEEYASWINDFKFPQHFLDSFMDWDQHSQ